jgi:non-ribosomal peptide synthase protein (TIGR01720 family)
VCVPSEESRTTDIASAINNLKATWTCLTPSVANVIESPESVPTLQTFASAADPLTPETIKKWGSGLQLLNAYGPTEASVIALSNEVAPSPQESTIIGRSLESGRAWLTNPENPHQLAPVGAVAELCLEGPFLARGYWNNPAKTAEVFIENPKFMKDFSKDTFSRIYRTGDLVRYAFDGRVHYLGRKDNQIKLAGQRMELGEIEHHLQADETVKHAVVLLPKSGAGKRKLTAVVAFHRMPSDPEAHDKPWNIPISQPDVLRQINVAKERLSDLVPPYMVPTLWIAVPRIPALASAKLDRKQVGAWLGDLDDETYRRILETESSMEPAIPASRVVANMQSIWAKVLNMPVENVKPNKTWVSLGGDSITAMQLLARCRKEGINITLNQVLRSKSLAHLAESVQGPVATETGEDRTDTPFALSPIQRFYFKNLSDDNKSHFNQSFTLRLARKTEPSRLKNVLDAIVGCHSMLRARFIRDTNGAWLQTIPSDLSNAYAFNVHNGIPLSDLPKLVSEAQESLNVVSGPVFATMLLSTQSDEQVLFLTAHHLVIDVVSWRIILGDLEESLTSSTLTALHKGLSFSTWNEKQLSHTTNAAQIATIQKQSFQVEPANLAFWGLDKRPNVYGDVERETFSLDEKVSALAMSDHKALRTDIVDLFLAAVVHSFSRVFVTRKTPTVFNETHGREPWEFSNLDLSRTVGWFTTMYPVHVDIAEDEDDVIQTVRQVKDLRRKVTDNGRPYFAHRFLTEDGQTRFAEHEPIEILFNYLGKMQQLEAADALFQPMHFSEEEEARMSDTGAELRRLALFEVSASVDNGKVQFTFMYNQMMKNRKGIRRWITECQRTLEEIVSSLSEMDTPQPTLSDFPLLPLDSYDRLKRVVKSLSSVGVSYPQVEDIYPCAAVQEGMILSQIKDPNAYWSFTTFELKAKRGRVDVQRVLKAWKQVVDRHQALRTLFVDSVCKGGVFDQVVVRVPDTGALRITCADDELTSKLDSIRYRDLNGKRKPHLPHQLAVVQTTSGRVVVKMEINHVVIDGGSLAVIRHDLEEAYEGRLQEEEGPLYSAYIKYLRALPMKDAIDFWKGQLQGVRPCHFPIAPQHSSKQRQLHSLFVDFKRFSEIQVLAERSNVTFANILLAAWSLVLHTYTSSSEVCYGYLTSGRNVPINGIESAVGAFINMLVSRVKVSNSHSLLSLSENVQNDFLESVPYQHCSLAQFQHDLGLSGQALFNTAVSVQNQGATEAERTSDANVEFLHLDGGDPSEFALTVNIDTTKHDEGVRLAYWTDSVSDEEAKNVSSLLVKILSQVLADPNQTVAELDAAIADKPRTVPRPRVYTPSVRSPMSSPQLDIPDPIASARTVPRVEVPQAPTPTTMDTPDWSNLIRSIVSEMVPQIVNQVMEKNKLPPIATQSTVSEMTNQMAGMLARRASHSKRGTYLETASIRSRRMSTASDTGSRIQTAADMVAAAGVMATEALKSVPPDFVEKKLLGLWSDLLDMVEDSIDKEDSFFVSTSDSDFWH